MRIVEAFEEVATLLPLVGDVADVVVLLGACWLAIVVGCSRQRGRSGARPRRADTHVAGGGSPMVVDWSIAIVDDVVKVVPLGSEPVVVDVLVEVLHECG